MKVKKIVILFSALVMLSLAFNGCVTSDEVHISQSKSGYTAQDLIDDKVKLKDTVFEDGDFGNVLRILEFISAEKYTANIKEINGMATLYTIETTEITNLYVDVESSANGMLEVALVSDNGDVAVIIEPDSNLNDKFTFSVPEGKSKIVILGQGGTGKIKMNNISLESKNATINASK